MGKARGPKTYRAYLFKTEPQSCVKDKTPAYAEVPETDSVMEIYKHYLSDGFVSQYGDFSQPTPITILRDTGAFQSLILADTLPFSEKSFSGTSVLLIQGVECGFVNVPLHDIYLSSDLVNGPVVVGIRQRLHFKGDHLLLGKDLAGDKEWLIHLQLTHPVWINHRVLLNMNSLLSTHHVRLLEPWQRKLC